MTSIGEGRQLTVGGGRGVEPSGGAMHSLFLFAGRLPGGLAILMGDGFQMTFFKD